MISRGGQFCLKWPPTGQSPLRERRYCTACEALFYNLIELTACWVYVCNLTSSIWILQRRSPTPEPVRHKVESKRRIRHRQAPFLWNWGNAEEIRAKPTREHHRWRFRWSVGRQGSYRVESRPSLISWLSLMTSQLVNLRRRLIERLKEETRNLLSALRGSRDWRANENSRVFPHLDDCISVTHSPREYPLICWHSVLWAEGLIWRQKKFKKIFLRYIWNIEIELR